MNRITNLCVELRDQIIAHILVARLGIKKGKTDAVVFRNFGVERLDPDTGQ